MKTSQNTKDKNQSYPLARQIADIAVDKKARDVVIIDLRPLTSITDYFVICTGAVDQHVKAIVDEIDDRLRPAEKPWHIEGYQHLSWVLMDYVNVVVHVFNPEARAYYNLERLWADAATEIISDDSAD
ncbi:MAG TPA: ribosome silencing factor [Candidatus Marinimicrobia bacterium]|nr:ribosome silencing factor [Candidatus Neomarinimicrobiota bacterium]HOO14107.1 ribosome silencing factor [Candidatus Neomarinimicrobiota bacterium]HPD26199.1 ribosome silencing factor [Candidatus Neomarinimicrobiota bacterium]HQC62315.1 ribosome silencing factor [Candidatus Neomarinimicrobiota bacterium]HRD17439.1 ribosome silencing factor [Candidatus Neomarinimicrobiota bacterium]